MIKQNIGNEKRSREFVKKVEEFRRKWLFIKFRVFIFKQREERIEFENDRILQSRGDFFQVQILKHQKGIFNSNHHVEA